MRILQVVPTSGAGGAEQIVLSLAKSLKENGSDVAVASPGSDPYLFQKLKESDIKAFPLATQDRKWQIFEIAKVIKTFRPDIIHSHMFDANLPSTLASLISRKPIILTIHSTVYELETWKRKLINALLSRCVSQVVAVSKAVALKLNSAGVPANKIICIYNGVDVSQFMGDSKNKFRQELCIPDDSRLMGMVANLRPAKDHEMAIKAAAMVIKKVPKTHFMMVGDGVDKTAQALMRLREYLGVSRNVHFLGFREDIPNVLKSLDLFVLASKVEGLPVSIIEAMAAGLPVVASNVGGIAELIEEGITGFLVPPGDYNRLAEKIKVILQNPTLAKSMGIEGRKKILNNFSLEAMKNAYYSLYLKFGRVQQ